MSGLVLDLTRLLPGPLAGKILASLGFRVMRLLPPQGDLLETLSPELHAWLNDGKTSEVADLKSEVGRHRLRSLVAEASILIDTNLPGVMERLQVGPESLRILNPRLVYVRIAGYRDPTMPPSPGHDLTYLAAAGVLGRLGPVWKHVQLADLGGAFWTVIATLDGLRQGGGFYEVYLDEASRIFAYPALECLDGSKVSYAVYPSYDGEVALAALEPHLWQRFCAAMKHEDWIDKALSPAHTQNPVYQEICSAFSGRSSTDLDNWAAAKSLPIRSLRPFQKSSLQLPWSRRA